MLSLNHSLAYFHGEQTRVCHKIEPSSYLDHTGFIHENRFVFVFLHFDGKLQPGFAGF